MSYRNIRALKRECSQQIVENLNGGNPISDIESAIQYVNTDETKNESINNEDKKEKYCQPLTTIPDSIIGKFGFIIGWPWNFVFKTTIPDTRFKKFQTPSWVWFSFMMSIVWIAVMCYIIVTYCITRIGCIISLPSSLMSLTIIAAGTSIPDALASVSVAKMGHGDMAVSNVIGSNIFDILLGLGLPFLLHCIIYNKDTPVNTDKLTVSIFILIGIIVFTNIVIRITKWKLYRSIGFLLLFVYIIYVTFAYIYGLS